MTLAKISLHCILNYIENKVARNISLLNRAKLFVDKMSTNLKKLLRQQKNAARIINNRTRFDHTYELFKAQKVEHFKRRSFRLL